MKRIKFQKPYLLLLFILWMLYGMAVAYGVSEGYLRAFAETLWESCMRFVPSILFVRERFAFDVFTARLIASVMLGSVPLLFVLMLPAEFENSVQGIRARGAEAKGIVICVFAASLIFFYDLEGGRLLKFFGNNMYGFAMKVSVWTFLGACLYRLAFCLAFKR